MKHKHFDSLPWSMFLPGWDGFGFFSECCIVPVVVCTWSLMWVVCPDLLIVLLPEGDSGCASFPSVYENRVASLFLSKSGRMSTAFIHFSVWGSDGSLEGESAGAIPICLMSDTRIHSPSRVCTLLSWGIPHIQSKSQEHSFQQRGPAWFTPFSLRALSIPTQPEEQKDKDTHFTHLA